jgi:hypothetical protein
LNELRKIYVSKLAETEFSNPNYRSENLKVNLEKTYGKKIMFIKMETHGKFESYLVASSDIDLESAIRCAYDLGNADKIGDTCSSCFSCAILWTVTPPSYSNRTVPSVFQLPFTLIFFLPSFSQYIQSGLNIILSGSRDLRRLLSKSLLPAMDGGGAGKLLRFIVNFW